MPSVTLRILRRRLAMAASLSFAAMAVHDGNLHAQQAAAPPALAKDDSSSDTRGLSASVELAGNNSGNGTWLQASPSLGYSFGKGWSIGLSAPYYRFNAATSVSGTAPASGIGDVSGSVTMSPTESFSATVSGSAPTGNRTQGFGSGSVGWDVSGYLSGSVDAFSPFVTGGVSNNPTVAAKAQRRGTGPGRLVPSTSNTLLFHAEGGTGFDLNDTFSLSGSLYLVAANGATSTTTVTRGRHQRSGATTTAVDDVSDRGLGLALSAQLTDALNAGISVNHSLHFTGYTTVTFSVHVQWSQGANQAQ